MHARCTVPLGCMLGASVKPWQLTQPALLRSASSWVWYSSERNVVCGAGAAISQLASKTAPPAARLNAAAFLGDTAPSRSRFGSEPRTSVSGFLELKTDIG